MRLQLKWVLPADYTHQDSSYLREWEMWQGIQQWFLRGLPAHVLLNVQWEQLFGDAEGQCALLHLFPHKHPFAVHCLKSVHLTYWVLEHWERDTKGGKKEPSDTAENASRSHQTYSFYFFSLFRKTGSKTLWQPATSRMPHTETPQKSHKVWSSN